MKRSTSDIQNPAGTQVPGIDNVIRPMPMPHLANDYREGSGSNSNSNGEPRLPIWTSLDRESRLLPPLPQERITQPGTPHGSKLNVDDTVAATDLQNPADALEFLANVAERDSGSNQLPSISLMYPHRDHLSPNSNVHGTSRTTQQAPSGNLIDYAPLNKGQLTTDMLRTLLLRYESKYHPFFPLANPLAFEVQNLPTISVKEPHLLAAILTVASKDEKDWWHIHETCSAHMQQLIAELVYSGGGTVEAVEAMLILAEWVPRRPHSTPAVGRGEEDQAAWMLVGTAIRTAYLLGIDRTGFRLENEKQSAELNRKRLAWAACYMSDRQVSVSPSSSVV